MAEVNDDTPPALDHAPGREPAEPPERPRRRRRLRTLLTEPMWVLGLVVLVDEVDKNIVRGLIDPLKDEFGVGDFAIGVLLSLQLLFNGIVTVPAGYLADRWNRTRAIGSTVIAWSALTAAGAGALTFPMLVGLRSRRARSATTTRPSGGARRSRSRWRCCSPGPASAWRWAGSSARRSAGGRRW
jgi:hypothetical protein